MNSVKSDVFFTFHLVQFYETDQMGVVHHSNYLRFFEECRVAWAHAKGLLDYQKPESAAHFAVLESSVRHLKPAFFGQNLRIMIQARRKGLRIVFQYQILNEEDVIVATGETCHVSLNRELKVIKLNPQMINILEKASWTETWH